MRRGLQIAVLAVGLVWVAAATANAAESPGFALFRKVCIDTHADHAAALAAGQAAGFVLPAPNSADPILANLQFEGGEAHGKLADGRVMTLFLGHKSTSLAGQPVVENLCAIAIGVADPTVDADAQAWVGVTPATNRDGNPFFVFTGASGRHASASSLSEADAAAAIQHGDMQTAAILHQPDMSVLVYGAFAP